MKTIVILAAMLGLFCGSAAAQTAGAWVSQGVADLSSRDLADANSAFAQAVALSPTNEPANVYYAATRILILPSLPAGSNFLTRLGFPLAGRNIYDWTAAAPKDTNGVVLAPAGVNANEFTAQMRTNLLPAIAGAISNLALVTDTNFTLALTSAETASSSVTLDFGDLKLIQSGLWALEYLIYTLHAENLDVQLAALRSLHEEGALSAGQILADYPQLFEFATTNDLQNARTAFTNAVNAYFAASDFIRARPAGATRLFNYDQVSAHEEGDFRLVLQDLQNSLLIGPQFLSADPDLTVNMDALFDDPASWRSLLPAFAGQAIELGSLPDLSFGGLIDGASESGVENFLGRHFTMLPVGEPPELYGGNALGLTFTTLAGHYYALEISTNLLDWRMVTNFSAADVTSTVVDSHLAGSTRRFYRLRDDTGFMAFSGVVLDQSTGLPIAGAEIYSEYDGTSTFSDAGGRFYLVTTLPSSWYQDELAVSAPGYGTVSGYYYGGGLLSGLTIDLARSPVNDNFANRILLTGATASATGNNAAATMEAGEPYDLSYGNGWGGKSVWYSWTAPTSGPCLISVSTTFYYPILAIYTGTQLTNLSTVVDETGYDYYAGFSFNVTAGQTYQIEIDDQYGYGGPFTLNLGP